MTAPTGPVAATVTVDDLDIEALTMWLRSFGARWSPPHVDAALRKLVRALDGDVFTAVAYLEWMAAKNTYLWRWLAAALSDELVSLDVLRTIGARPTVTWPAMPGRLLAIDDLSFDELIASAVAAESTYERILTANRAQNAGLRDHLVVCTRCDVCLTFQAFTLIHLARTERHDPYAATDGDPVNAKHGPNDVRPATDGDVERYAERSHAARQPA